MFFFFLAAGILFLGWAMVHYWQELKGQLRLFNYYYLVLALLAYPLGLLPTVAAWHALLAAVGEAHPFSTNLKYYCLSCLPRHIPGFFWFVATRAQSYKLENTPAGLTVAASLVETLLLAMTGFSIALPLLAQSPSIFNPSWNFLLFAPLLLLILAVVFTSRFEVLINKTLRWRKLDFPVQIHRKKIAQSLGWMIAAWSGGGLILFILSWALVPLDWTLIPQCIGIWAMAGSVSLTLGIGIQGFGVREATLGVLLSALVPPLTAATLAIAFRLVLTAGELLWMVVFIWLSKKMAARSGTKRIVKGR